MYLPARQLTQDKQLAAALRTAAEIHAANYGDIHGVSFRIVSKTETVSMLGAWNDFQEP